MNHLRTAAQQALEALYEADTFHRNLPDQRARRLAAMAALRAALAQQDEPVQEPYTGDVTRIMRDAGMTFHLGLPHKAVVEQMTRVVDLVYAEASIKAAQQFAAALAQQDEPVLVQGELPPRYVARSPIQAEPVEPVAAAVVATQSDVWRGYNGQWAPPGEPIKMVQMLRDLPTGTLLYLTPPQRKPLTEEEIDRICAPLGFAQLSPVEVARAVERAHGIKE